MDTHEISMIYKQRPQKLMGDSLGKWFAEAHGFSPFLAQGALLKMQGVDEAKSYILQYGLNNLPSLPLLEHNRKHSER